MEKIVIFGSTGMTGLCATEAAIKKGLQVRVLVRDPSKVPEALSCLSMALAQKLEIVKGDVLNYDDVLKAVQGTKAVVVALGTRGDLKPTTDLSDGLKNIVRAMRESGVLIVSVCLSVFLFPEVSERVPAIFKDITADHKRMLDVLQKSGLKYIAVLPPHIDDIPPSTYKVEHDKHIGRTVSKYDLGSFLVDSVQQPEHYGQICGIVSTS